MCNLFLGMGWVESLGKENRFNVKGVSVSSSEMLDSSKDRSSAEPIKSQNIDRWKAEKKIKSRNAGVRGGE